MPEALANQTSPPAPKVWLVGAGPGNPDLLTLQAVRVLAQASVALVDDLVSAEVLDTLPAGCRVLRVGKRGGCVSTSQAFIHQLMVQAAKAGEFVVRLKGGDPFMFARGGEEIAHLRAQGVAVEVVNGLSAGFALTGSLQLSLTHRDKAHGVIWVTGHAKPGSSGVDWSQLGQTAKDCQLTLVIYMGVAQSAHIRQGLLQSMNPQTPVLMVEWVSHARQRHLVSNLSHWLEDLEMNQFASPSMLVVGDVIGDWQTLMHSLAPEIDHNGKQIARAKIAG